MTLRAIIVDDEQKGINSLKTLIELYISDLKVVASTTLASNSIQLIEDYKPDIVFLDINMPQMNGFELLERLSWKNFHLIFVTAHQEYALKALKNNAFDYILKPIDRVDLKSAIEKIKKQATSIGDQADYSRLFEEVKTNTTQKNKLLINLKSGIEYIDTGDIIFLESKSNYTRLYFPNSKTILATKTLKEFEDILCNPNSNFMRTHHSFIVNLKRVLRYLKSEDKIILTENHKVPVSKNKKDSFFSWLNIENC